MVVSSHDLFFFGDPSFLLVYFSLYGLFQIYVFDYLYVDCVVFFLEVVSLGLLLFSE